MDTGKVDTEKEDTEKEDIEKEDIEKEDIENVSAEITSTKKAGTGNAKVRDSRFELLRIIAMLMIISFHICFYAVDQQLQIFEDTFVPKIFMKLLVPATFMPLGQVGVDLFFMISGYFMAGRRDVGADRAAVKLLKQMFFAAVILMPASWFIMNPKNGQHYTIINIKVFNSEWWFVGCYILLIVMAGLFLNRMIQKMSKKQCVSFLIFLFALFSIDWTRELLNNVYYELSMVPVSVFCYVLGGCVQKYDILGKIRTWVFAAVIILSEGCVWFAQLSSMYNSVADYVMDAGKEAYSYSLVTYPKAGASVIVTVMAISLFELFKRLPGFHLKLINFLGGATFMIYLLHEQEFVRSVYNTTNWITLLKSSPAGFILCLTAWVLCIFAAGAAAYALYLGICRLCGALKSAAVRG